MNHLYAKLADVGCRAKAGIFALRKDDEEEYAEPMLTEDGGSLILIERDPVDAD